jgi:lambda repressor-like predicted transcriptional regulator
MIEYFKIMKLPDIDIKQALRDHRTSQLGIARSLGISHTAVRLVIEGKSTSARVSRAIADALGVPVSELWPETTKEKSA